VPAVETTAVELLDRHIGWLLAWLDRNGWAGWDPYDLWDQPFGLWAMARESLAQRVAGALLGRLEELFPVAVRRVLHVQPRVNAKGMGLFAAALLDLERIDGSEGQLRGSSAAAQCFDWLERNRVEVAGGVGWGYPFDWRSRVLIPRNTPTAVTTAFIGDAYWLRYVLREDAAALACCEDICRFILGGLNRSPRTDDGAFCFSYTPVDHFQVHNANLLAAEFLVRLGTETGREEWIQTGLDAGRFTLRELQPDGSLAYWSNAQQIGLDQDLFHSGFEIRALDAIARTSGVTDFREAADRYFQTWLKRYFADDGTPIFSHDRPGAVEVHSCAEALLCACQLADRPGLANGSLPRQLERTMRASVRYLWVPTGRGAGYFAWISQPRYGVRLQTSIPMIRMGQAWMLRGMSAARVTLQTGKNPLILPRRAREETSAR